jgi:hypothetical protein
LRKLTTVLADYKLPSREAITSVNSALVDGKRYVAVGTAVFTSDDAAEEARLDELSSFIQADKGRFVLLEPELQDDATWTLKKVTSLDTTAPVLDSVTIHNFIAIATPAKVSILLLDTEIDPDAGPILLETAKCTFAFEAHFLAVSRSPDGDNLVVGDAMRSILVLDIDRDDGSVKWDQRDMSSHAVRALAEVRDDGPGALIADVSYEMKAGWKLTSFFRTTRTCSRSASRRTLSPPRRSGSTKTWPVSAPAHSRARRPRCSAPTSCSPLRPGGWASSASWARAQPARWTTSSGI